jgi:hypothetical protein
VHFEDLRAVDERRLRELFYRSFDLSRVESLLGLSDARLDREATFLGEGTHFRAWRLRPRAPGEPALVLKRAGHHLGKEGSVARRQWTDAMLKVKGTGGLVPPFELVEAAGRFGIVMPYGDKDLKEASPHWQPVQARLAELDRALSARGLVLQDIPQGRTVGGIPFIYDFSDLGPVPVSPSYRR